MKSSRPKPGADGAPGSNGDLVVVGVGASAGGLDALTELLEHFPADPGVALVVIQHLDPNHQSELPALLSGKSRMDVTPVHGRTRLEPNCVYVISPGNVLTVSGGDLIPESRPAHSFKPIDIFFESLAEEYKERAIGVVLSGTATDGTIGLKRIKIEGGITFAQDQSAKFDSMPRSAVAAGAVDFVLPPRRIAEELVAIALRGTSESSTKIPGDAPAFERLLNLLRGATGVDFSRYKQATIARRLNRRMALRKTETIKEYLSLVQDKPDEIEALFDDLLINVTDFFRDSEVFESARRLAFPVILQHRKQPHTIRVWVPGCSTGEEVYTLAIILTEFLESQDSGCSIQMFGTDVSEKTIGFARRGIYNQSSVANVSPERLRRFFVRSDSGYQLARSIRELCIFSRHNVAKDPPLSRMDLISCRNLLIYFSPSLQRRVIGTFSYSLQPGGCLILGPSETLSSFSEHFSVLDETRKIYCRRHTTAPQLFELPEERLDLPERSASRTWEVPAGLPFEGQYQRRADQIVLSRYGPAGLIVDEMLRIAHYRGDVRSFLVREEMEPGADLMAVIKTELRPVVSAAIEQAQRTEAAVVAESPHVPSAGGVRTAVSVIPLSFSGSPQHFLILLGRGSFPAVEGGASQNSSENHESGAAAEQENTDLRQELTSTREYLRSVIEELRSTNEEVQSANEELQSTNEEMQTSKEELQSSNEELHTINAELQSRNAELAQLNDDLVNLLGSMNMPIVMTGRDLRIRRFTPIAERLLRLIPTDIGRPIADLKPRINVPDLDEILAGVLQTLQPCEREVEDQEGRFYIMRVRPYRTSDDRIDGAVLQLLDVSELKRSLEESKSARDYATAIVNTIHEPLAVLDDKLNVRDANRAFYEAMDIPENAAKERSIFEVSSGRFNSPSIHSLFDRLRHPDTEFTEVEIDSTFNDGDIRSFLINARRLRMPGDEALILMAFADITEQKRAAETRYRRLFESARDGIVIADAERGDILDLNPFAERLLGYRQADLIGRKLWDVQPMLGGLNIADALDRIRERGVVRFDEFLARTSDGRDIEVEVIATVYSEGDRQLIQLNMRDVSERKKFEVELRESQKLESLGLLAGGIAHDFNNLLTGILGNASIAVADTGSDNPIRFRLRQIVDAAERAAFLTRQMLAYAGRGRFVTASIDLSDLVREISSLVRTSIPKSVDVRLELAPDLPQIEGDPAQVQQIVMNLVINAAEAIGENSSGVVTIRTSVREVGSGEAGSLFKSVPADAGTYVQLEVADTGAGMDENTRARIFDPFFTTKFTGRGLGLAAVQGIVKGHRGAIFVNSIPGRGSTFCILLPASARPPAAPATRAEAPGAIPPGSIALLIDDERLVRNLGEDTLTRYGMKVLSAANGKEGVEIFRDSRDIVSVIILDLRMPVMSGEDALPILREINPDVPIILSSGFDEIEATELFAGRQAAGFLQKPYTAERLVSAVAAALHQRKFK